MSPPRKFGTCAERAFHEAPERKKDTISSLRGQLFDEQARNSWLEDQLADARMKIRALRESEEAAMSAVHALSRLARTPRVPRDMAEAGHLPRFISEDEVPF